MARFINLYSGSSGNCTYIRTPDVRLLFDAGRSALFLKRSLESVGERIEDINAIFITHEHTDHTSALKVILKKNPLPVYAAKETAGRISGIMANGACGKLICYDETFEMRFGDTVVTAFRLSHDSDSCVGYRIDFVEDGVARSFGLMTDTGYVTDDARKALTGCEAVMVESNHDVEMLRYGPYPEILKERILSNRGHLSNWDCSVFCRELADTGTRCFMLAHLSEENNFPSIARTQSEGMLEGTGATVCVACPDTPTVLI
ncbi:MAG: MBL fold metallo-hydrolase [Clostridia bacterium]|nr:MBL fold metallo-hydrolase [Clostridia bacterium]